MAAEPAQLSVRLGISAVFARYPLVVHAGRSGCLARLPLEFATSLAASGHADQAAVGSRNARAARFVTAGATTPCSASVPRVDRLVDAHA
jgi:hypothetical protein